MICDSGPIVSDNPHMKNANRHTQDHPGLSWHWCLLPEMEPELLYDMLALREAIFVVEQTCIYQELDGLDKSARHLLVKNDEEVVACLRVLPPEGEETRVRIGRVAVASGWRQRGVAAMMMSRAIEMIGRDYPSHVVFLDTQTYLQGFYETLGFSLCGDEFLEDGIPHVPMERVG